MKEGNIKAGIRSLPATFISILKFASLSPKLYKMMKPKQVEFIRVDEEYLLYHYLPYNPREDSITQWRCLHFKLSSHCLIRELPIPLIFLLQRNASVIVQKKELYFQNSNMTMHLFKFKNCSVHHQQRRFMWLAICCRCFLRDQIR